MAKRKRRKKNWNKKASRRAAVHGGICRRDDWQERGHSPTCTNHADYAEGDWLESLEAELNGSNTPTRQQAHNWRELHARFHRCARALRDDRVRRIWAEFYRQERELGRAKFHPYEVLGRVALEDQVLGAVS